MKNKSRYILKRVSVLQSGLGPDCKTPLRMHRDSFFLILVHQLFHRKMHRPKSSYSASAPSYQYFITPVHQQRNNLYLANRLIYLLLSVLCSYLSHTPIAIILSIPYFRAIHLAGTAS